MYQKYQKNTPGHLENAEPEDFGVSIDYDENPEPPTEEERAQQAAESEYFENKMEWALHNHI